MLEDDHFESFTTGKWAMVSPIDSVMAKIHQAKGYVFRVSVVSLGGSSMWKPSGHFDGRWTDIRQQDGLNTSKSINAKVFDCELNVNPGFTSAQLLATIKQHVSSTLGDVTPPHHLLGDDEGVGGHRQAAQECRLAHPARSGTLRPRIQPGHWIFVGPGPENTWRYDQVGSGRSERQLGKKSFPDSSEIQRIGQ